MADAITRIFYDKGGVVRGKIDGPANSAMKSRKGFNAGGAYAVLDIRFNKIERCSIFVVQSQPVSHIERNM